MSDIVVDRAGSILTLSFNRPTKRNAITHEMYQTLADQLKEAAADFGIRVVVFRGEGDHYTAGNDIGDFLNSPPMDSSSPVINFLSQIYQFPKPIICGVKGNAVGIGTTMLLHSDINICDASAKFSMPFVSLGLVPEAGSSLLFTKLAGYHRAAKIFLTGESFSADYAHEIGLVAEIVNDVDAAVKRYAEVIADQPPGSVLQTKALLKSADHEKVGAVMKAEAELFALALQSDEAREAFFKFMAKKKS
ncbi:MAG: enoyl-CoA hydratase [Actinobacteria bacterium]|nr:enoyl-CoA hydratase [Actinomycetota bacterium]